MLTLRRLLGALVAVTLGVTVVACSSLLLAAGRPAVPDRLAAAAVLVQSPATRTPADPFPPTVPWTPAVADALAARLGLLPGVAAALPDHVFYAQQLGDDRVVEGHGWSSARMSRARLIAGRPPQRPGEVVLNRAPGPITLLTADGPAAYTVTGTIDRPELYLADPVAATLAPGVRAIGLVLKPDTDPGSVATAALRVAEPGSQVRVGDERGALEPRSEAYTRWVGMQILTGTTVLAGFATIFVVAATFALVVAQRRRELALMRTIGATPRQVSRLLRREALAVGLIGSLAGTALGTALAPVLDGVLVRAGVEPDGYAVHFAWWPIAVALLTGPVVASLGVTVAAWRAARVRPLEALRDAAAERRRMGRPRWLVGGTLIAAGALAAIGVATAGDAQSGGNFALLTAMALVSGAAVLAPAVVPATARVLTWPAGRLRGATALLVRQGAIAAPRRSAATAAPVLLTVAFAVLVSGLVQTTTEAYAVGRATAVDADRVVAPDGTPGLTDAAVRAVPGVSVLPTTVFRGNQPLSALGVDAAAYAKAQRRVRVVSGSLTALGEPGTVVLTESVAGNLGKAEPAHGSAPVTTTGRVVRLTFADGSSPALRTVAVVADGSIPGDLLLARETVRRHDSSALTEAVYADGPVRVPPGAGARVIGARAYAAEADAAEDRLVWVFTLLLIGVSAGYGAIAVATTLLMAAAARGPDLRVLRRTGATSGQIRCALAAESGILVAIGSLLGGLAATAALLGVRAGLSEWVGAPVALVVPWPVVGGVIGLCLVLAVGASVLPTFIGLSPGRRARRARLRDTLAAAAGGEVS
jgi:putative ABC transport system permease protein